MHYLDLDKIACTVDLPTYLIKAARQLIQFGYLTTGDYFKSLTDEEVEELTCAIDNIQSKNYRQFMITDSDMMKDLKQVSLLCFILASGEGESEMNPELLPSLHENLVSIATVEGLSRKGKVLAYRENYSLLDDKKIICRITKG